MCPSTKSLLLPPIFQLSRRICVIYSTDSEPQPVPQPPGVLARSVCHPSRTQCREQKGPLYFDFGFTLPGQNLSACAKKQRVCRLPQASLLFCATQGARSRIGQKPPSTPQRVSVLEDGLRSLGEPQILSLLREKESETSPSQLPQATRKQFARWNSTSNANKIIMTIFMGECGGLGAGFHYRVYKCARLCTARLPLQAAAAGWRMVIRCKLPPNMVIPCSARGV